MSQYDTGTIAYYGANTMTNRCSINEVCFPRTVHEEPAYRVPMSPQIYPDESDDFIRQSIQKLYSKYVLKYSYKVEYISI